MAPPENLTDHQIERLRANLVSVRQRIADAAHRSERQPEDVHLVAVTKRTPLGASLALRDLGVTFLGESRPEEICRKAQLAPNPLPWHLIGPFQTKKIAKTLPHVDLVHSVHSVRLGQNISERVQRNGFSAQPILLQVDISGEEAKQGLKRLDVEAALEELGAIGGIIVRGLMTMAPRGASNDVLSDVFGSLRDLQKELDPERLPELSMGMSSDFEVAIEQGATLVRVGSALFEGLAFTG
jgi:hypothetical protein